MNELVKKETDVTSQEEHIPQIGDHYLYNSHGYERIIRVERQTERGFLVSTMQENGEFEGCIRVSETKGARYNCIVGLI